jgi:protein gp37
MANDSQMTGRFWDEPWNVWYGCTPVGEGCRNCWAKALHNQRRVAGLKAYSCPAVYADAFQYVRVFPERLEIPLHWKKPRIVAVNFAGDPYHEAVSDEMLDKVKAVEALCRQHTFIELTKRWERRAAYYERFTDNATHLSRFGCWASDMAHTVCDLGWRAYDYDCDEDEAGTDHVYEELRDAFNDDGSLPNVWQGVSVSTQAELDAAWPYLRDTPAAVRVLSLEPLLERMEIDKNALYGWAQGAPFQDSLGTMRHHCIAGPRIDWVIVGCETGPNRRQCPIEHIESVVAQCKAAGVSVWVKAADLNGRVSHDMAEWPESIRVRELPGKE